MIFQQLAQCSLALLSDGFLLSFFLCCKLNALLEIETFDDDTATRLLIELLSQFQYSELSDLNLYFIH